VTTPTDAQRRAMETVGRDLCVTAGAGSGKTFTLVGRTLHLLVSGEATVGQILAITFTEKAAAEMKERIAEALEREGLHRERRELEGAAISTIHAFCARLLREHAIHARVDPRFSVLEQVEADGLRRQAFEERTAAWRESRATDLGTLGLVRATRLAAEVLDLHDRVRAAGIDPATFVAGEPADGVAERRELGEACQALADVADGSPLSAKTRARVEELLEVSAALFEEEGDPWETSSRIREIVKGNRVSAAVKPAFRAVHLAAAALHEALAETRCQPARVLVAELVRELEQRYRELKEEAGYVDFADLELRTLALLEERPEIAAALRRRFPHCLMDEMQDVSRVQARLLEAIRPEGGAFSVGDVKQSIYGFRHADADVILEEARRVGEEGRIVLAETFRSRPEVLEVVGRVFAPIWPPGGRIVLDPLEARGEFVAAEGPCVELLLAEGERADPARRREADLVADRLVALFEHGTIRRTRRDREGPVRWGDVAVLLRATRDVKIVERALLERDVPYRVIGGRGFWEAREIVDLANLLRVVAGPGDDEIALAAVLRSPIVGLDDEALLRLFDGRRPLGELPRPEELTGEASDRLAAFRELVADLRAARGRASLASLVDRALERTGLGERVLLKRNGRQRLGNLRKVRALARDLDAKGLFSLTRFVDLIEERRDLTIREAEAPPGDATEDAVTILTVHSAKGLEFPVVFVPDLMRGTPGNKPAFLWSPEAGLGVVARDGEGKVDTPTSRRLRRELTEREAEEAHRVLYVAMTRAAEHLVLSAGVPGGRRPSGWLATILDGLGLDLGSIPPGESRVGAPGAEVRVLRSPATEGARIHRRRPLADARRDDLVAGRPLAPELRPEDRAEVERMLAEAAAPPAPPDLSDFLVTVTEVVTWSRSPEDWYRRFRRGLREADAAAETTPWRTDGGGSDEGPRGDPGVGRAAHRLLELAPAGAGEEVARAHAERYLLDEGVDPARAGELVEGWRGFHESEIGAALARAERVRREAPFLVRLPWGGGGGTLLRGTLDLLLEVDGEDWLVDYKTGRADGPDTAFQMRLYTLALERVTGRRPARAILWSLPRAKGHEVSLTELELGAAWERLRRFVVDVAPGSMAPR
jgi:ATP-dependent helicase/nuclease subunit A